MTSKEERRDSKEQPSRLLLLLILQSLAETRYSRNVKDFPGGPAVKESALQCRGFELDPWLGT